MLSVEVAAGQDTAVASNLLSSAVIAAVIAGIVSFALALHRSLLDERARVRDHLASAIRAVNDYAEFPYAIRRRRSDQPEAERVRLSESMRAVQSDLSYYEAWTIAESKDLGAQYALLVNTARQVAGRACAEAWNAAPPKQDSDMNISVDTINLSEVRLAEQKFAAAARRHLRWMWVPWLR